MIYNEIVRLEKLVGIFNREPLTSGQLLKYAAHSGIVVFPNTTTPKAEAFIYRGRQYIAYNPNLPESHLVLNLGHELGHYALGHIQLETSPTPSSTFSRKRIERDAGIIGFLCWIPTFELCRMDENGRLNIEELYKLIKCLDPDLDYHEILRLCHSRISIYNAYKRLRRQFNVPAQQPLPFPHVQLKLF